ncbi:MAG: ABC transporter permease, partial [Brevundimonas sp.]
FDTAGALAVAQATSQPLSEAVWADRPEAGRIYAMVEQLDRESCTPPRRSHPVTRTFAKIGLGVYDFLAEAMLSLAFLGRLIIA